MPKLYPFNLCKTCLSNIFDSHVIILLFLQLLNACIHESRRMEDVMLAAPVMFAGAVCSALCLGE